MAKTVKVKLHDTWPPIETILKATSPTTGELEPIDLTQNGGVTEVKFIMKEGNFAFGGACTGPFTSNGKVVYKWASNGSDTGRIGKYKVEYQIRWANAGIQTVPNGDYDEIEIVEDLG